jgi:predicted AAA+ superfamily ATPase
MYPAVLSHTSSEAKREELADLTSSALYRDILEFQQIKNPSLLTKLLKLLALQIGSEVSLHSMAQALSIESRTVERYIDLLEKSYIIYRTPPYYTNKKKEIIKTQKIYFYDVGIRNAILGNYTPLSDRDDVGRLWENWVWSEWIKKIRYNRSA